jgi:hypothetical protein
MSTGIFSPNPQSISGLFCNKDSPNSQNLYNSLRIPTQTLLYIGYEKNIKKYLNNLFIPPEQRMHFEQRFHKEIIKELDTYLAEQDRRFPKEDILTIDLHVHDHNSDVPDETMGRILRVPETYLPTEDLMATLEKTRMQYLYGDQPQQCQDML